MTELEPFIFIRHGETDWNREGRFQGRTDVPLNDAGREQANRAALRLDGVPVSRVLVSPLSRAVETAERVFAARTSIVEIEPLLTECDFGSLDGTSIAEAMKTHGITRKEQLAEILPADGESWSAIRERCSALLERVVFVQEPGRCVVLVGHDALLQGLAEQLTGQWFDARHAEPYRFERAGGDWRVDSLPG